MEIRFTFATSIASRGLDWLPKVISGRDAALRRPRAVQARYLAGRVIAAR